MSGAIYTVESGLAPGWEDEFLRWQAEEHVPLLLGLPGYRAVTRFRAAGLANRFLNLWEVDSTQRFHAPSHDAKVNTPWKARIVPARELLILSFYNVAATLPGPAQDRPAAALLRHRWPAGGMPQAVADHLASDPATCRVHVLTDENDPARVTLLHLLATDLPAAPIAGAETDRFIAISGEPA
ncbi:hypothetical protein ACQW02_24280 [Humitalea sp. 24SJ18S-53]|uniref:hypothetical protein n=1 Tax=Humitalea sp. 24SJ18S-53 TaxID=3422307 RepID=UPI003D66C750